MFNEIVKLKSRSIMMEEWLSDRGVLSLINKISLSLFHLLFFFGGACGSPLHDGPVRFGDVSLSGRVAVPSYLSLDHDFPGEKPGRRRHDNDFLPGQRMGRLDAVAGHVDHALDPEDYYRVFFESGDVAWVEFDGQSGDVKLSLFKDGESIDSSDWAEDGKETLTILESGEYSLLVRCRSGRSIYNLATSSDWPDSAQDAFGFTSEDPERNFVPGQAVVKFKPEFQAQANGPRALASRAAKMVEAEVEVDGDDGTALLSFSLPGERGGGTPASLDDYAATLEIIERLSELPEVEFAEPNYIYRADSLGANDFYYSSQWGLDLTAAYRAWEVIDNASGIIVAVVDTGVLYDHPDLFANVLRDGMTVVGHDLVLDPGRSLDGDGVDPDPYDAGDKLYGSISSFHGTYVSGVISAVTDNVIGVSGVARDAKILPVRVLGREGGVNYDIAQGIRFAAGLGTCHGESVSPAEVDGQKIKADIINLSLGGSGDSRLLESAVADAMEAGSLVVASAGNDGSWAPRYPAAYENVITVAAADISGRRAEYSNYGLHVEVAAPGNGSSRLSGGGFVNSIRSTGADDRSGEVVFRYDFFGGTSAAAPHVSGALALLLSAYRSAGGLDPITQGDALRLIGGTHPEYEGTITGRDRGGRDPYLGFGIINAEKAALAGFSLAGAKVREGPRLSVEPRVLYFDQDQTEGVTSVINLGPGGLAGMTVESYSIPWVDHHELKGSTLTVAIDPSGVSAGPHYGELVVGSENGGTDGVNLVFLDEIKVPVFVVLFDPDQCRPGERGNLTCDSAGWAETGSKYFYNYSIWNVPPGRYYLAAGTDLDGDGFTGEPGELLGYFSKNESMEEVEIFQGQTTLGGNLELVFRAKPEDQYMAGKQKMRYAQAPIIRIRRSETR